MRTWIEFTLKNFATPLVFYATFRAYGAKLAIAFAIAMTCLQLAFHWWKRIPVSPFFLVASGFTVLFGSIDLFLARPRYFRLEPAAQNFVMGFVFLATVIFKSPIAVWFARALPERVRPDFATTSVAYFRNLTVIWSVYFIAKAALFLYLALRVDLGTLIVLRSAIGGGTLAVMFAGEILYRKFLHSRWSRRTPAA